MKMRVLATAVLCITASFVLGGPGVLFAHTGLGPHGGTTTDAGPYFAELVAKGKDFQVYVYDDASGNPVATAGAKGSATVLVGEQKETVTLQPGPGNVNLMVGSVSFSIGAGARIVVQLQLSGQAPVVARFTL